ncbi:MAG: hypothetical protein ACE37F_26980 [Nannocystaceae bacterium]|nr:hypothetical protein [bacterium]
MALAPWLLTLAIGWAPPSQTRQPPEETITAPPPPGGRRSGGAPPAPRLQETPSPTSRSRPGDVGLERLPDGSYRYVDAQRRFTMTVAPDGRAYFADRWRRPSSADSQNGKIGRRPGARSLMSNPGGFAMQGPLEWLMRASGHDLATSAKMSALRETEAFRTDLAIAWNRGQIRKRLRELPADLLAVWGDASLSLERRREILFEHWDACEDRMVADTAGIPAEAVLSVDRLRREAGEQARTVIEAFVRRELGGDEAFTPAELDRFNARRVSVATFDPYAQPEPEPEPEPDADTTQDPAEEGPGDSRD